MQGSAHVLSKDINAIREVVLNLGARTEKKLSPDHTGENDRSWDVGIFDLSDQWTTVVESSGRPREMASALAHQLQAFSIAVILDDPVSWSFHAFNGHELVGKYSWEISQEFLEEQEKKVQALETDRLKLLGLKGLIDSKKKNGRVSGRIAQSDPRVEMSYRSRISQGTLDLPDPEFPVELPRNIHKLTGLSTAARIRNIISTPHTNVGAAVSEFGFALGLPNWIDDCRIDSKSLKGAHPERLILRMIEKT